ncbi:hypothetical protein TIFTF001_023751 [Ficus carica]|uniref:Uncharacterized protein n=1 Tax=Ficus carica TaxID=3494 RepID=A0AA88DK87_FICCA|nr:hypothetical protein TIFTF001_023751 [Ficus carica]
MDGNIPYGDGRQYLGMRMGMKSFSRIESGTGTGEASPPPPLPRYAFIIYVYRKSLTSGIGGETVSTWV